MKYRANVIYVVLAVLLALTVVQVGLAGVHAQQANRAALVVDFGDGSLMTRCVEFNESEISGYDLLTRSGLDVVAAFDSGQGAAICAIEGEGCPVETCLTCAVPNYWSYWHLADGSWAYSGIGSSNYKVSDGAVEGWRWGTGDPPPVVPFDQVCAPPPTDTPLPTETSVPPSPTPELPTETPILPSPTSESPTETSVPPSPTGTPEPIVWFRLDQNPIPVGSCTMMRWDTTYVLELYLDGEAVSANGSIEVCPTEPRDYHLRVVTAGGEQTYALVLGVSGTPAMPTSTPEPAAPEEPSPTPVPQPTATVPPEPAVTVPPEPSSTPLPQSTVTSAAGSPTPQSVTAASTAPSHTPAPEPTSTPASASEPAQSVAATLETAVGQPAVEDEPIFITPVSYVGFGLIAFGLLGLLIFILVRR